MNLRVNCHGIIVMNKERETESWTHRSHLYWENTISYNKITLANNIIMLEMGQ